MQRFKITDLNAHKEINRNYLIIYTLQCKGYEQD